MTHEPPRYAVWHTTGKADGDSCWETLADAEREFDHQSERSSVVEVELIDYATEPPVVVKRFDAAADQQ